MDQWASRRKNLYLLGIVVVLTTVSFFIFWKFWYRAPTCFDNLKNGDEVGVDCGGSCTLICSVSTVRPIVRWDPRFFEISPGVWSVLIYIENPNTNAVATYFPYKFVLFDENNNILATRDGATILPLHKTVGIFEGGILIDDGLKPRRALFEFGDNIVWQKVQDTDVDLVVTHSPLLRLDTMPRIEAKVKNDGFEDVQNIELVAAVFDGSDNVIAASRTFVEKLNRNEIADVFFTWPRPFELGTKVCENPVDVMLLLDRSGSMSSLGSNPPQPLTDAKGAASSFIKSMTTRDKVGVSSFATTVKNPIDFNLTNDFDAILTAVDSIQIDSNGTQYTNIYEALYSGWQELVSPRSIEGSSKVAILLTDGMATAPINPKGGGKEADDIKYAETLASEVAINAKRDGVVIYTIGLGSGVNEAFLKQIASEAGKYYFAPGADNLESIYKNISSEVCQELPARVEITYKVFGQSL